MFHDNRRQIIEPENFKGCDLSDTLLDSKPLLNRIQENKQRFISKFPFTIDFNKKLNESWVSVQTFMINRCNKLI